MSGSDLEFGFHHGAISVHDMQATIEWYGSVLGFELEREFEIPAIPAQVAILRNGGLRIEVFKVANAHPLPCDRREPDADNRTIGNKHVAFAIRDVDAFSQQLEQRGADIVWVKRMPHGANIFIRDNSGNLIEFVEEPSHEHCVGRLS
jgi:methylmalonyl-CoA/ethylmalonyl-CoA epimerase